MRYTARQGHYIHGCGTACPKKRSREGEKQEIWSQEVASAHPLPAPPPPCPGVLSPQPRVQARFAVTFQHPLAAKDSPLTRLGNPGRGREETEGLPTPPTPVHCSPPPSSDHATKSI